MAEKRQKNYFIKGGANYALYRPSYPHEFVQALASECMTFEHALDVGCGSGQFSVLLANWFDRVTATDPSQSQLNHAYPHPNVTYRAEPAEMIDLPNESVNLIVAAQAAHWFDLPRFYAEVERVAAPECVLAFVSYGVPVMTGGIGQRLADFYWKDIHEFWPKGRQHVETGYRSLEFPYKERGLPPMVIERNWSRRELLAYVDTWSAIRKAKEVNNRNAIKQFETDLAYRWPDREKHIVSWPITARIATVG